MSRAPWLCFVLGGVLAASVAQAHPLAPAALLVEQDAAGRVQATFKRSLLVEAQRLGPRWPEQCQATPRGLSDVDGARLLRFDLECGGASLVGMRFAVQGLEGAGIDAMVRVSLEHGRVLRALVTGAAPEFRVPASTSTWQIARDYLVLGIEHLLTGLDHVLFVLALLWIVPGLRRLLWTLTAFTVGHSVTLCLAALEVLTLPQGPVEVAIAATLVLAALQVLSPGEGPARFGWVAAAGFGLVHGLGFAGALSETGLPANEVPLSLASFNLGIEVGQVLVVLAWALARFALGRAEVATPNWLRPLSGHAVGALAAMWFIERLLG